MGPLQGLLKMIPGMGQQLGGLKVDDRELDRLQAIITSMTPAERANPEDHRRLAPAPDRPGVGDDRAGGLPAVKQFAQMQKMMRQLAQGKMPSTAAAGRAAANLPRHVRPSPAHASGQQEESRSGAWSSPTSARRVTAA